MSGPEKEHIVKALQFELSMVETKAVRERMVQHLSNINDMLAAEVAAALGEPMPESDASAKARGTADSVEGAKQLADATSPTTASGGVQQSKALSMENQPTSPKGRKVAILVAAGIDAGQVRQLQQALTKAGAMSEIVGPHLGMIAGEGGELEATKTLANASPALFDAVFVPGGKGAYALKKKGDAQVFLAQSYKHGKAIGVLGDSAALLKMALPAGASLDTMGVVSASDAGGESRLSRTLWPASAPSTGNGTRWSM